MEEVIKVLVFGATPACARCLLAEREARQAAGRFPPGRVVVEKHDALSEVGRQHGVNITPTVLLMGKKVAAGRVIGEADLVEIIKKEAGVRECQ